MSNQLAVLDLFSAAAGGWSLGMHRAGFHTVAACEWIDWRRALYLQNNPGVRMYDDVRTLTGRQLLLDLGFLPGIVVGSPPCQDVSPANTKGKGVEGERSGLYFEAVRIIGEIRDLGRERGEGAARWVALENSSNLRTRGADAVLAALEAIGYTCWSYVVRAGDIGANHERPRCWIIACDVDQVADASCWQQRQQSGWRERQDRSGSALDGIHDQTFAPDADGIGRDDRWPRRRSGLNIPISQDPLDTSGLGHESGRARGRGEDGHSSASIGPGHVCEHGIRWPWSCEPCDSAAIAAHTNKARSAVGQVEPSLREATQPVSGCNDGRGSEVTVFGADVRATERSEVGLCARDCFSAAFGGAQWSLDGLADHLRLDDGLSAWVAQSRVAVGGPRGTSAASLIVEAFGDAVVPQIPEAIGRAILRTERALAAVYQGEAA